MNDRPTLREIEQAILKLSSEQFGIQIGDLTRDARPVQDLGVESLDLLDWMMAIEDHFSVGIPEPDQNVDQAYKEVFTRSDFRLRDMAELVHLRWGLPFERTNWRFAKPVAQPRTSFGQLGGTLGGIAKPMFRQLEPNEQGFAQYRRETDGMVCIQLPGGSTEIGSEAHDAGPDEQPTYKIELPAFLIDSEVVSTTAYCRFLNSIIRLDEVTLATWFFIRSHERRHQHQLIEYTASGWRPRPGAAEFPMVLVSWFGASAYSLWANGGDWTSWNQNSGTFLPSETQWEYAARGLKSRRWPWGDRDPLAGEICAGVHLRGQRYDDLSDIPMIAVNELSGVSPFGIKQMAGNVWQWCDDWYDPTAYARRAHGDFNQAPTGVRCERGGSWVGPADLCRSSYRRGRNPYARGRCLGFRCVGEISSIDSAVD